MIADVAAAGGCWMEAQTYIKYSVLLLLIMFAFLHENVRIERFITVIIDEIFNLQFHTPQINF